MSNELFKNKVVVVSTFCLVAVYLIMQFKNVMIYFDDYGYYSLTYGVNSLHRGNTFSLNELVDFLKVHYVKCNGRVLWFFIWLFIYRVGNLKLVQLVAAIITTIVLFLTYKISIDDRREHRVIPAILVCTLYGLFSLNIQRHGTYWLCPFFLYVAPLVPLLIFLIKYFEKENFFLWEKILLTVLIFISAFSQEQLAVTVVALTSILVIYEKIQNQNRLLNWIFVFAAIAGTAILMLSPGLHNRASSHDISFINLISSMVTVFRMFFSADMKRMVLILHFSVISISCGIYKEDKQIWRIFDIFSILIAICSGIVLCWEKVRNFVNTIFLNEVLLITVGVLYVTIIVIQAIRYYIRKKLVIKLVVFLTAVASVACLCVVPELPYRLLLPSWFLLFPFLTDGILAFSEVFTRDFCKKIYFMTICSVLLILACVNSLDIYCGYARNAEIHRKNDRILNNVTTNQKVYLQLIPEEAYGSVMVYEEGYQFIKTWMLNYYGLDSETELYYSYLGDGKLRKDEQYSLVDQGVYLSVETVKIENISYNFSDDRSIQFGISCTPIYKGSSIMINGKVYPTIIGSTFISTEVHLDEIEMKSPISIQVAVPNLGLLSENVEIKIDGIDK